MTSANQHIVTCFEQLSMTPEQIAEAEGFNVTAVKSILYQESAIYRDSIKEHKELDFTDSQLDEANTIITNIMRYAEDDGLRYRAAKYLRDDKKGRKDKLNGLKSLNINILQINQHLNQVSKQMTLARAIAARTEGSSGSTDRSALGRVNEKEAVEV